MASGKVNIVNDLKEEAMEHANANGSIADYEVPGGIRMKLLDVCEHFRTEILHEKEHADKLLVNLAAKWKQKLFDGLEKKSCFIWYGLHS
jgi:hypothetical protein